MEGSKICRLGKGERVKIFNVPTFSGELIYKYNNEKDELYEGWPKKIEEVYKPMKDSHSDHVPKNLDTIFFDMRDKNIYFFKDDMVNEAFMKGFVKQKTKELFSK